MPLYDSFSIIITPVIMSSIVLSFLEQRISISLSTGTRTKVQIPVRRYSPSPSISKTNRNRKKIYEPDDCRIS